MNFKDNVHFVSPGIPSPEVKWYRDGDKLKPKKDPRISTDFDVRQGLHILTIRNTTKQDEGCYKIKIVNEEGSVSVTVMVTECEPTSKKMVKRFTEGEETRGVSLISGTSEQVPDTVSPTKTTERIKKREDEPCEPKIEVSPQPVEFIEGGDIQLSCKVSG